MTCQLKQFTLLFTRFSGIKEAGHAGDLIGLLGDEEGVSHNVQGVRNDKHCCSMTILDDVLTFGELAEEEQAGWPHPHPGASYKEWEADVRKRTGVYITEVFWR
jgi:hypothetical protein